MEGLLFSRESLAVNDAKEQENEVASQQNR
jgi:hypothetical protein